MATQQGNTLTRGAAASAGCDSVQTIIDIAATAEAFAITALGHALANVATGTLVLPAEAVQALIAARAEEQTHYDYLVAAGATALTLEFTIPDDKIITDPATFLTTLVALEETFIAAYMAAAQEFAVLGEAGLAQLALQIGAVEAEHRVGVRFFAIEAGVLKGAPNDVVFEKAMFASVSEAAAALKTLGFIGGTGTKITYPGPGAINYAGVTSLKP